MTILDTGTSLDALTGSYEIDPAHTRRGFAIRHMVTAVHGQFTGFSGRIELAGVDLDRSVAELSIDTTSVQTNNPDRDTHLRSGDFFDVEQHPTMIFRSARVRRDGAGRYAVSGDLTIKGITRPIDLALELHGGATDPYGQFRIGLTGTGAISRADWDLSWNVMLEAGGLVLGDRVTLELDASAIKVG